MEDIFKHFSDPINVRKDYHKLVLGWGIAGVFAGLATIARNQGLGSTFGLMQLASYGSIVVWMAFEVRADNGTPYVNNFTVVLKYLLIALTFLDGVSDLWGLHVNTGAIALAHLLFFIAEAIIFAWTFLEIKKQGLYKEHVKQAMAYAEGLVSDPPPGSPSNSEKSPPKKDDNRFF
jgi:hypothetical protein